MKKWILLIWLFCVQLLAVHAENEYYTIFKVGSNICTPVTLKTPYGNYTIHTEITIPNLHIPADTRSAFPVISVQSPVSIQCCWQS